MTFEAGRPLYIHICIYIYIVECRYNVVHFITILHTKLWWQHQNINQTSNSQQTPHISPTRASYGVYFMRISKKTHRVITAPHYIYIYVHIYIYIYIWQCLQTHTDTVNRYTKQNDRVVLKTFSFIKCHCVEHSQRRMLAFATYTLYDTLYIYIYICSKYVMGDSDISDIWASDSTIWWRHQMETFSALLAFCVGNSPVTGEFPTQRPVTRSFDAFFDLTVEWTIVRLVIWDAITLIMTSP